MDRVDQDQAATECFIDPERIRESLRRAPVDGPTIRALLAKAGRLGGLSLDEAASLLQLDDPALEAELFAAAGRAKQEIYGRRMVLFAPLYLGNRCSNDCLYCAFRAANRGLARRTLDFPEIEAEARALLREGHKRLLVLSGEDATEDPSRLLEAIRRIYALRETLPSGAVANIRRINVEVAPLTVAGFRDLVAAGIGTYACFQESYDPAVYARCHQTGPKADYFNRLYVMDRAMAGGIDDVGIGALFGLGDWRFEVLGLLAHAAHLETAFGCGPHTVSVPRIEPAEGAPAAAAVPQAVSDRDFKRLIAVLRLALPYTGLILSTRENEGLRDELFRYGVSQISAGSRTNPGAYAADEADVADQPAPLDTATGDGMAGHGTAGAQFQLGDHRDLGEVTDALVQAGYVPSFCTGCYRQGRTGADFMDLAKPGLIKRFCEPNALFTYREYLADFGTPQRQAAATQLGQRILAELPDAALRAKVSAGLAAIDGGQRDVYL